jgi:hypothetical protein
VASTVGDEDVACLIDGNPGRAAELRLRRLSAVPDGTINVSCPGYGRSSTAKKNLL